MIEIPERPAWMLQAACRGHDPAIFFPERGESIREAVAICNTCPVSTPCLDYSIDIGAKHGVWAGLAERRRRPLRRQHRLEQQPPERRCEIAGCTNPPDGRYCRAHDQRRRRWGDARYQP